MRSVKCKGFFVFCSLAFFIPVLYVVRNCSMSEGRFNTIQQLGLVVNSTFLPGPSSIQTKEYVYPRLPLHDTDQQLIQLHWTSLGAGDDSYHFFSSYYDGRASKARDMHRPAVFVIGYVRRTAPSVKFYCLFRYGNRSVCREKNAIERHVSPCFAPQLAARPYHYLCEMSPTEEVPLAVHLSTSDSCKPDSISDAIPVQNRNFKIDDKAPAKFGVCLGSPLVKEDPKFSQNLFEYIEMSKAVGVQRIVFYVNEELTDMDAIKTVWKKYPDVVKTISWRKFDKWDPLHYYGQLILVNDCFYRSMYEVDYLAVTDFDEMITPVRNNSWDEMVTALNSKDNIATFTFQNAFFTAPKDAPKQVLSDCSDTPMPKYFSRTVRHDCFPGYEYRPKIMSRPRYVYEPSLHWSCAKVEDHGGNLNVPPELGILAHYRPTVPDDCINKPTFTDTVATKFKDKVTHNMCKN